MRVVWREGEQHDSLLLTVRFGWNQSIDGAEERPEKF